MKEATPQESMEQTAMLLSYSSKWTRVSQYIVLLLGVLWKLKFN